MKKSIGLALAFVMITSYAFSTGEPSTYFNIFIPPNNDAVQRNVALIVTAIYDSTYIDIVDDDMDGDSDDSYSGVLLAGQSYVLYIKDNGINDDARYASGGVLKQDGDYFTITSNKLVYASQSTDSDWQFDYVPSINKKSVGEKFIVYAPQKTSSNRDLNAFAYEDSTTITVKLISTSKHTQTGKNTVNIQQDSVVIQRTLMVGEDLIHFYPDGRNVMESGHTYLVESNKPISLQYGALYGNSRDGGGYVPSQNGSSSGDLFYFTVPYQVSREQEIRIVSWDSNNTVSLDYYNNGNWASLSSWNLGELAPGDWVGKDHNASYQTVFRVQCASGKKVSVFTANWLETGNPGTSDIATMVSSKNGTTSGREFLCYMAPPGNENNVIDPFTGNPFGGQFTHLYLFAKDSANVQVVDAKTGGNEFNQTFQIAEGRYADCALSINQWKAIYNGDGKSSSGPERPYLLVTSDANISVMNTNFNDNWMMYFGSSLEQSFGQTSTSSQSTGAPGDTISITSTVELNTQETITSVSGGVSVGSGALPISSTFVDSTSQNQVNGDINTGLENSLITYDSLPDLDTNGNYAIVTEVVLLAGENDGSLIEDNNVVTVETTISGNVGGTFQQSTTTEGISNEVSNAGKLIFRKVELGNLVNTETDSWNASWIDIDGDDDQDLFVTTRDLAQTNTLYRNNGNGTFTLLGNGSIVNDQRKTMSSAWADYDNDGDNDVLLLNNNYHPVELYSNNGNGSFKIQANTGFSELPGYFHGAAWGDFNNDGFLDLVAANYMPTKFHEIYMNDGDGTFTKDETSVVGQVSAYSVAPTTVDFNNDGLLDIFFPNNLGGNNSLFKNTGNGFVPISQGAIVNDGGFSVAACWADVDRDGDMDVFVANSSAQKDFFYFNNGDGTFTKDSLLAFASVNSNTHGCNWVDVDNDMDLDLYLTDDQGAKQLYIQKPGFVFELKPDEIAVTNYGKSYGQAVADYDRDGHVDLFVSTHSNQNNFLWNNNGNTKNFLNLKLIGTVSNKNAIGSAVKVKCGGIWQTFMVSGQAGFGSQNSLEIHVGLDTISTVDSIVIDWPSGHRQIETTVSGNQFIQINESASTLITGRFFLDLNENCAQDANETALGGLHFVATPGNRKVVGDANGFYQFRAAPGNLNIVAPNQGFWSTDCDTININILANDAVISDKNLGMNAERLGPDISVSYGTTAWRRGFSNQSVLSIKNGGTAQADSIVVNLNYPVEMHILSSSESFSEMASKQYQWLIDSLKPGETAAITILDSVGLSAIIGQSLSVSAQAEWLAEELDSTNNTFTLNEEVVGAIDPNDMLAWPTREKGLPFSYVSASDTITYKVRFQNVGTYEATHVFIKSTLPANVNPESLKLINASHSYGFVQEGRQLEWSFRNIGLPDSNTNEPESHGFVSFAVVVTNDARNGADIFNQAEIVFDYEDPLTTNVVHHRVKASTPESKQLKIWPNPALVKGVYVEASSDIHALKPILSKYSITDIHGNIRHIDSVYGQRLYLSLPELEPGVYSITAWDTIGQRYVGHLIVI